MDTVILILIAINFMLITALALTVYMLKMKVTRLIKAIELLNENDELLLKTINRLKKKIELS